MRAVWRRTNRATVRSRSLRIARCVRRLARNSRQALGQNVGGTQRPQVFRVRHLLGDFGYHQHLFQLVQVGRGNDANIKEQVFARLNRSNLADRQSLGEDAIAAAGNDIFPRRDLFVTHDVLQGRRAVGCAFQNALQAGVFQRRTHAAELIVDRQHLRRVGKDLYDLAHNSGGRNDRHVGLDAVARTFIDVQHARLIAAAGANDLGRDGGIDILFFEAQQRLDPARHGGVFLQARVVDLHALDFSV